MENDSEVKREEHERRNDSEVKRRGEKGRKMTAR